jgi:hypothetical protein
LPRKRSAILAVEAGGQPAILDASAGSPGRSSAKTHPSYFSALSLVVRVKPIRVFRGANMSPRDVRFSRFFSHLAPPRTAVGDQGMGGVPHFISVRSPLFMSALDLKITFPRIGSQYAKRLYALWGRKITNGAVRLEKRGKRIECTLPGRRRRSVPPHLMGPSVAKASALVRGPLCPNLFASCYL